MIGQNDTYFSLMRTEQVFVLYWWFKLKIEIKRDIFNEDETLGQIFIDGDLVGYSLEDPVRDKKIYGRTAIPAGVYQVKFREVVSPKTERYRKKFKKYFSFHLEIQDVPNFQWVYFHIGNTHVDTDGCILGGVIRNNHSVLRSVEWFESFYIQVAAALVRGEEVILEIS